MRGAVFHTLLVFFVTFLFKFDSLMAQCGHSLHLSAPFFPSRAPLHLSHHALCSLWLMVNMQRCRATIKVSARRKLQMPRNEISQSMDVNQWHRGCVIFHQKTVILILPQSGWLVMMEKSPSRLVKFLFILSSYSTWRTADNGKQRLCVQVHDEDQGQAEWIRPA